MNKNYKDNLKNRNLKEEKKVLDIKEYKVAHESELLSYLIEDLHFSRNNAKALLSHHLISVDGAPVTQYNFMLAKGDSLIISKKPIYKKKRDNLPIVFENKDMIVINKPYGLLSVASDKEKSATAYRMVMDYVQEKDKKNRVYVVHRLDKETSGILMFVKNEKLKDALTESWNNVVTKRGYYAVVEGILDKKEDRIVNYLNMNALNLMYITSSKDKKAYKCITNYKVIKESKKYSLLDINLETGRKNQIRVTLGSMNHYVLGDDKYGEPENPINRLCLHSYELAFLNPLDNKKYDFKCDMPLEFDNIMKDNFKVIKKDNKKENKENGKRKKRK